MENGLSTFRPLTHRGPFSPVSFFKGLRLVLFLPVLLEPENEGQSGDKHEDQ